MQMSGQETIAASRQRVWDTLYDPELLKRCIPGCQSLTQEADDRLRVIAEIKIGPILISAITRKRSSVSCVSD